MNIKSIAPLLILLLLGVLAFYFLQDKSTQTADQNQDWVMHIENTDDIHRVYIADRKGGEADLVRDGDRWIYNKKYTANPHVMSNVLNALKKIRLKNRPATAAIPNMIKALSTTSNKVEVYDKKNKLMRSFYVGGVTPDERGTFMILEGSENPYVMHMPMQEVSLKQRFFTGERKWRDKTVIGFKPQDISTLSIEYPKRKNMSFNLKRNKGKWDVEPFYVTTRKIEKPVNQDLVNSFLREFKSKGAEAFEHVTQETEKVLKTREFCIIKILFTDGTTEQVNFFPKLEYEDETSDKPMPVERYTVVNSKNDIFLVQHLVFKDIFWAYDFFFEGE